MALSDLQQKKRTEFISDLRELADWYESRPELRAPTTTISFSIMCYDKLDFLECRRATGLSEKRFLDSYVVFQKKLSGGGYFDIAISKEKTCNKVKIGEIVIPAVPEHTVDQYEWQCDEPLLAELAELAETEADNAE